MELSPELTNSTQEGIEKANEYFTVLTNQGLAEVFHTEPRGDVITDVTIEGVRFQAFAAQDPYVARKGSGDWCQLGVASIHLTERWAGRSGADKPEQWMVCKYSANEWRVDLSPLTESGRRAFAVTFGIPIGTPLAARFHGAYGFYTSVAFYGLVDWARRHPRKFKSMSGASSYVGNWKELVTASLQRTSNQKITTATPRVGAKTGAPFKFPVELPEGWKAKALPDRTIVILEYWVLGSYIGAVTVNEVDRNYAFGADTQDPSMQPYAGRNWRQRLYRDAINALVLLIG